MLLFRSRHNLQFIRHTRDRRKPVFFISTYKLRRESCVKQRRIWHAQLLLGLGQAKDETVDTVKNSEKEGNAFVYKNCSYKVQQVLGGCPPTQSIYCFTQGARRGGMRFGWSKTIRLRGRLRRTNKH